MITELFLNGLQVNEQNLSYKRQINNYSPRPHHYCFVQYRFQRNMNLHIY